MAILNPVGMVFLGVLVFAAAKPSPNEGNTRVSDAKNFKMIFPSNEDSSEAISHQSRRSIKEKIGVQSMPTDVKLQNGIHHEKKKASQKSVSRFLHRRLPRTIGKANTTRQQQQKQIQPCQRVDMIVNATDLQIPGIVLPDTLNIYRCTGSCSTSTTRHGRVVATFGHKRICCVAVRFSPAKIVLSQHSDLHQKPQFVSKRINDLVVKECGCK